MSQFIKLFFMSAVVFLIFDLFWLLVVAKRMYQHFIGHLMGETQLLPAILFYIIFVIGVTFFVIVPGIDKNSLSYIIVAGALFGLVCYATYDLTNLATLKNWPIKMTIIDLIWGTSVTTITSVIVFYVQKLVFGGVHL